MTELKARYGVALSPETIRSGLIIGGSWRVYSERDKPSLSPRHMEARLAWAKDHLGSRWVDHVDIDEKWFYEFAHKRKLKQPRSEGQGCSSARKWRNFSVKRRLWEISTSVRTSVHAFDVILVMKVPYIGQKMFACSFRVGQPALPVRPVPLQVSMPTRMCMVGRWTWSSSLVLGPQWASRLALAATRAAVLPP